MKYYLSCENSFYFLSTKIMFFNGQFDNFNGPVSNLVVIIDFFNTFGILECVFISMEFN